MECIPTSDEEDSKLGCVHLRCNTIDVVNYSAAVQEKLNCKTKSNAGEGFELKPFNATHIVLQVVTGHHDIS